jgi:hypothetical protein
MPYAIFSKRTGIVNRVVDDLEALLPSESMIEIDREANYPRGRQSPIEGQDVNTAQFPLFYRSGSGTRTVNPQRVAYRNNRPYTVKNPPIYVAPQTPSGDQKTGWLDIPLGTHPFAWTGIDLANQKYSSVLSQNYPFQVAIGEEFINDDHIDTGSSSGYTLAEGQCMLRPDGVLVTDMFEFHVQSNGVVNPAGTSNENSSQYVFDTYYLNVEPDFPEGIQVSWQGKRWSTNDDTGYFDAVLNEDYPTTELGGAATTATVLRGIQLKIQNLSSHVYSIENYLLLLRIRNLPAVV